MWDLIVWVPEHCLSFLLFKVISIFLFQGPKPKFPLLKFVRKKNTLSSQTSSMNMVLCVYKKKKKKIAFFFFEYETFCLRNPFGASCNKSHGASGNTNKLIL